LKQKDEYYKNYIEHQKLSQIQQTSSQELTKLQTTIDNLNREKSEEQTKYQNMLNNLNQENLILTNYYYNIANEMVKYKSKKSTEENQTEQTRIPFQNMTNTTNIKKKTRI